jgi:hypothetical protein
VSKGRLKVPGKLTIPSLKLAPAKGSVRHLHGRARQAVVASLKNRDKKIAVNARKFVGTVRDITARKQAEEQQRACGCPGAARGRDRASPTGSFKGARRVASRSIFAT